MTQIRVLVADDQALLRGSFRVLLETTPDMTVVGGAGTSNGTIAGGGVTAFRMRMVIGSVRTLRKGKSGLSGGCGRLKA